MSTFRIVETTTRYRTGFLSVDETRVQGAGGEQFSREVVRHPGAVVVVPVDSDGEHAWCVRQFRAAPARALLEVPAGKRDVKGEPPEVTARRELEEEIGRRPGRLVRLCEFFNSPGFCDEYSHLFCALDLELLDAPRGVTPEERAMAVERVAFADLEHLIASGMLVDAKSIIGLMLTRRFLAGEYHGMAT